MSLFKPLSWANYSLLIDNKLTHSAFRLATVPRSLAIQLVGVWEESEKKSEQFTIEYNSKATYFFFAQALRIFMKFNETKTKNEKCCHPRFFSALCVPVLLPSINHLREINVKRQLCTIFIARSFFVFFSLQYHTFYIFQNDTLLCHWDWEIERTK